MRGHIRALWKMVKTALIDFFVSPDESAPGHGAHGPSLDISLQLEVSS